VYGWFRRWLELGLFEGLLHEIARLRRRAAGRRSRPRLAIIDTQTVKCIAVRGPRGYDAGKQVLGRKRVALVDADGHWLAVATLSASVQDRDTLPALNPSLSAWPSLRLAVFDGAFTADVCRAWANFHGMRHQVVSRAPDQKGFVVLARRWVMTGCTILPGNRFSFGLARVLWAAAVCRRGNAEDDCNMVVVNCDPPYQRSDNRAGAEPVEIIETVTCRCGKILKLAHDQGQLAFSLGCCNSDTSLLL
jgi:hypothetical protein